MASDAGSARGWRSRGAGRPPRWCGSLGDCGLLRSDRERWAMGILEAIGNIAQAAGTDATEAAATSDGKEEAAAFLKQLARTALTMASNSLMEAQDTMNDLEDDDD